MIPVEFRNLLFQKISEVNLDNIATAIKEDDLQEWISSWKSSLLSTLLDAFSSCDDRNKGWVLCEKQLPNETEIVQILSLDENGDYSIMRVDTAWRHGDKWISHDDFAYDVIAWQPLANPMLLKDYKELVHKEEKAKKL